MVTGKELIEWRRKYGEVIDKYEIEKLGKRVEKIREDLNREMHERQIEISKQRERFNENK